MMHESVFIRFLYIMLLSLLSSLPAMAQTYGVKGKVLENSEDRYPLPFVKVQLRDNSSRTVAQQVTGNDGAFHLQTPTAGNYQLRILYVGYDGLTKEIKLTEQQPEKDLGDLLIGLKETVLNEASVTATAQKLTIKADTFIYNTKAFHIPPGATLGTLVKQLPGLEMSADGKVRFHGKDVQGIFINGRPFFSDTQTALANVPAEAVQNVKAYEKSDEEKDFAGKTDTEKKAVLDLTIKKEYMSAWNTSFDLAGGTDRRYLGKLFATNFTERRRIAIYGQINNISETQSSDENGNWRSWNSGDGLYTYRSAGGIFSWDNGKTAKTAGHFSTKANFRIKHNDLTRRTWDNAEEQTGNGLPLFSYSRSVLHRHDRELSADWQMTWNIDTLRRINVKADYLRTGSDHNSQTLTSAFDRKKTGSDIPQTLLQSSSPQDEGAVFGYGRQETGTRNEQSAQASADYTRRFARKGQALTLSMRYTGRHERKEDDGLYLHRTFDSDGKNDAIGRLYEKSPSNKDEYEAKVSFSDRLSGRLSYVLEYRYGHDRSSGYYNLYRLDRYEKYASISLPAGIRPCTADSIEAVRDMENSYASRLTTDAHTVSATLEGQWDKLLLSIMLSGGNLHESLAYDRNNQHRIPSRSSLTLSPSLYANWSPAENINLRLTYSGGFVRPELTELLPLTDTGQPLETETNNPDLKTGWKHGFSFLGNIYRPKRGDMYLLMLHGNAIQNDVVRTLNIDPATGHKYYSKTNVNGNYEFNFQSMTMQPLDRHRQWNISGGLTVDYRHSWNCMENAELSLLQYARINPSAGISWRERIWNINFNASYAIEMARYTSRSELNQNAEIYRVTANPQLTLPCGLRAGFDLTYHISTGYADATFNRTQWLWNASISQSFLKNKALSIELQAIDLLRQRKADNIRVTSHGRYYSNVDTYLSYALLHISYRFNTGGKDSGAGRK